MKKNNLLLLLFSLLAQMAFGQINWRDYSQSFPAGSLDKKSDVGLVALEKMYNNSFWSTNPAENFRMRLSNDSAFLKSRPTEFVAISTFDTSAVQFILHGVNRQNAKEYEYRVLQDSDKVITQWSPIKKFIDSTGGANDLGWGQVAYLGGFTTGLGHTIIVDVRTVSDNKIIGTAVAGWQSIQPHLIDIYTASELNEFLTRLNHGWALKNYWEKWSKRYPADQLNPDGLPKKLVLKPADNNLIFYLSADITDRKLLEYEVIRNDKVFTVWRVNDFDQGFIWLKNLPPGNYHLKFRYKVQPQHVTTYPFEIKTAWYQSTIFKITGGSLIAAFFGFIIFVFLYIRQRQKSAAELSKKTKLQLELQTVHSQLNPHFVFNALSSIQGLVNKNDIAGANHYLSDFAGLLRNSLLNSNKEQTPLAEELKTLETYLKLEQLRFNFNYEIVVGDTINIYETEMPSLLLQPLIENAIKHGIAGLKQEGQIWLNIKKLNQCMIITLRDNGNGFDPQNNTTGIGLVLTRNRIILLNQMMNGQQIELEIESKTGSTTIITLTFSNWFNEN